VTGKTGFVHCLVGRFAVVAVNATMPATVAAATSKQAICLIVRRDYLIGEKLVGSMK
jgi:hypothetical protein